MSTKHALWAVLLLGLSPMTVMAQTAAPPTAGARNPVLGDPGPKPDAKQPTAAEVSRADKQPPGTQNGNQPDRAQAGGGSR